MSDRHNIYSRRYADNWGKICYAARRATKEKCCLCNCRAAEVHHVRYRDCRGAIAGREVPGRDVFPLCKFHHERVHKKDAWTVEQYALHGVLGNCQKPRWVRKLKRGFRVKTGRFPLTVVEVLFAIASIGIGAWSYHLVGVLVGAIATVLLL